MNFDDYLTESIETNHDAYRRSHGKRAAGSGNWMIGVGTSNVDFDKHKEGEHYIQHNGPLGEAVKKAREVAKKHGKMSVHILP